jgi:hypothetical protein
VQAAAEAFAISQLITEALTAIVRDHRRCGRRAHIHVGAGGTPTRGMWLPRSPGAGFSFAFNCPGKDRDRDSTSSSRWWHRADNRRFFGHRP